MAIDYIYQGVLKTLGKAEGIHLDIGAGRGELIKAMQGRWPGLKSYACDFHTDFFQVEGVENRKVNLDAEPIPYEDGQFDVVTMTEVIEHVENPRALLREVFRVLKPGGVLVLTTPNVLNVKSRVRNLAFGFANLFGPLPMAHGEFRSTGAHISPIGYFYLAHALCNAGFAELKLSADKEQATSRFLYALWGVPINIMRRQCMKSEVERFNTIDERNRPYVEAQHSREILFGRTVIVKATKPK